MKITRRKFLRGVGGVTVGLPLLDAFRPAGSAGAATPAKPIYSAFVTTTNGVVQDQFWPKAAVLTKAGLAAETCALQELNEHAERLIAVKGINHPYTSGNGCGHAAGGAQTLTAARPVGSGRPQRSPSESVETRIARETDPQKREAMGLYAGFKKPSGAEWCSYPEGGMRLRTLEGNPWVVFQRLMGLGGAVGPDAETARLIAARRLSVNDYIRGELRDLLGRRDLSRDDRARLDLHFTSVRDTEIKAMAMGAPGATMPGSAVVRDAAQAIDGKHDDPTNTLQVANLQMDLLTLAFATDQARTAVLQIGPRGDGTQYVIDGQLLPSFHQISHRIFSDGASGPAIPNAAALHHKHDRMFARTFKYLLDKLAAYTTPEGSLIDLGFFVWANELSSGPDHGMVNIPHVIAGGARGFLKTGRFITLPATPSNKILNTYLAAAGCRKSDGTLPDDFGDPTLAKGTLPELLA